MCEEYVELGRGVDAFIEAINGREPQIYRALFLESREDFDQAFAIFSKKVLEKDCQ